MGNAWSGRRHAPGRPQVCSVPKKPIPPPPVPPERIQLDVEWFWEDIDTGHTSEHVGGIPISLIKDDTGTYPFDIVDDMSQDGTGLVKLQTSPNTTTLQITIDFGDGRTLQISGDLGPWNGESVFLLSTDTLTFSDGEGTGKAELSNEPT